MTAKRKRDSHKGYNTILIILSIVLMLGLWVVQAVAPINSTVESCIDVSMTALIVYGTENNRINQSTNQLAIDRLAEMTKLPTNTLLNVVYKPLDVALYNNNGLMGTMLFMQADSLEWVVQINDANRVSCGLYQVNVNHMTDFIVLAGV